MSAIEKDTNGLYRQKYFVEERSVIRYRPPMANSAKTRCSSVIPSEAARVSEVKVPMNRKAAPEDAQIAVQLFREGHALKRISIKCPCGRHAELELEPTPAKPGAPGTK